MLNSMIQKRRSFYNLGSNRYVIKQEDIVRTLLRRLSRMFLDVRSVIKTLNWIGSRILEAGFATTIYRRFASLASARTDF